MKRLSIVLVYLFAIVALFAMSGSSAQAATPFRLHPGMQGKRVCAAKWLLSGHRPTHFRWLKPYHGRIGSSKCFFGNRLARSVKNAKYRLGYPKPLIKSVYGDQFQAILVGKRHRPLHWIALAARRRRLAAHRAVNGTYGARAVAIARREIGCREWYGSNYSTCVGRYQRVTGAYRLPWCMSFVNAVWAWAGIGPVAYHTAYVPYFYSYARSHGWLRSFPRPGYGVIFTRYMGHTGIVERTTRSGFYTIEGNTSNMVARRFYYWRSTPVAFVAIPSADRPIPVAGGSR